MINRMIHKMQCWAMLLLVLAFGACADDWDAGRAGVIDENGMVSLTIHADVPGLKLTRAVDVNGENIATLWVLAFNGNGYMMTRVLADQTNNVSGTDGGSGTFTVKVPSATRVLHFLANVNMDNFSDQTNIGRHENEVIAPLLSSSGNLVYWGRRTFETLDELKAFATDSQKEPVVLYRNQALVQYDLEPGKGIEVEGWAICNQYAFGTVAPYNATAENPFDFDLGNNDFVTTLPEDSRVKQRDESDVSKASDTEGDPRYLFENINAEDDQVYLIMKMRKNQGEWKYYKVMLVNDVKEPYKIIRNHKYIVHVSDVKESFGVNTFADAKNATPANNPWITISDEIPEVVNGQTTLRIEGETTVIYQKAGDYTIDFYYNGSERPSVKWLSNDGVASAIAEGDVEWDAATHEGHITLHVNAPAQGSITYGTLQVKEQNGVLSRRVKVLLTEPFEFDPVWISSEIPLLDGENITLLFSIPDNFPEELLPIDVKFGCDLIDAQTGTGNALKVITENTVYTVPHYNNATHTWEDEELTLDWNYKYVYSADTRGLHKVNFRTILTSLGNSVNTEEEFHIYMEGDDSRNGQDLFRQRDLFFAFQPAQSQYRIKLTGGDSNTNYSTRTIDNLNPVYGEEIEIPFTLGTLTTNDRNVDAEIWVYYDTELVKPSGGWAEVENDEVIVRTDYYGNSYSIYKTTSAANTISFTTRTPNFDCYIVLSAKSIDGYGDYYANLANNDHSLGVNERGYRSASVTIHSTGRLDFNPKFSTDNATFTPVADGGQFAVAYGTGKEVYLKIEVPEAARNKAFQFKLGTKYLEPVSKDQWTKWTVAEGDGWTYTFKANEATGGTKIFALQTTRLASEETLTLASGNDVGFNSLSVDIVNPDLSGTLKLPDGTRFDTASPYVILERASDGTRIGAFDLGASSLVGSDTAAYDLALRGEYNLNETDRINVKWSPIGSSDVYIYSGTLRDLMQPGVEITLIKQ